MTFVNQLSARVEYRKSRQLSLSLVDYQLAENRSTEYSIGLNYRKKGVPFLQNLKIGKNGKKLDNDVTFRFDYSLRDDPFASARAGEGGSEAGEGGRSRDEAARAAPPRDRVLR